jgi:hypothetical protein
VGRVSNGSFEVVHQVRSRRDVLGIDALGSTLLELAELLEDVPDLDGELLPGVMLGRCRKDVVGPGVVRRRRRLGRKQELRQLEVEVGKRLDLDVGPEVL